jgi:phosphoenolpyruvate carboxykinase (ATP)
MHNEGPFVSRFGLEHHGIHGARRVYWNLPAAALYEQAVLRSEALLAEGGALVATTGTHTGRSPTDRFIVRDPETAVDVWWGNVNRPFDADRFEALLARVNAHWADRDLFVFDGYIGTDPRYRLPIRVVTEKAWHSLFARNMFVRERDGAALREHLPGFTVLDAASFEAEPRRDGTASPTFILINFTRRVVLIGGTAYAGEIKKGLFSVMNYLLPKRGIFPMHCSANYGAGRDDVALFFGLSGTGKTTLSADPARTLVGDDEHAWSDDGVFNLEGGCYAKVIRLSAESEPEIYATTRRFGTILENVVLDPDTRRLDLDDERLTENTRGSYPISHLERVDLGGLAGHPRHVLFLTCDAFGVLPPLSRLTFEQAMYHFLSGYTAKVAGTERGVTEPKVTFSACFGAPFMPLHPGTYARMLGERLERHDARVWLLNTGWTGGPYGTGGRIKLAATRRMVHAALAGELERVPTRLDPIFGLAVPEHIDGVPDRLLRPRETWRSPADYDAQAAHLADLFVANFEQFEHGASEAIRAAGPRTVGA